MLHFHRFHDEQLLAFPDAGTDLDVDGDDRALQRRAQSDAAVRHVGFFDRRLRHNRFSLAVREHRERVSIVDACTGQSRGAAVAAGQCSHRDRCSAACERGGLMFDEARGNAIRDHVFVREQCAQEREVRRHAADRELGECAARPSEHVGELVRCAVHDDLREQRVVVRAGGVTGIAERIDAYTRSVRRRERGQCSARGFCITGFGHRLHVDARLQRVATRLWHCVAREMQFAQCCAAGDAYLRLNEIDAGDFFGDGVFDLQARVCFDEHDARRARVGAFDQKLERAEAAVMRRVGNAQCRFDDRCARCLAQRWAGRHFDEFLMATLQRAFAFPQVADLGAVADDLHFDVARVGEQFFRIQARIAERRLRFRGAALECVVEFGRRSRRRACRVHRRRRPL